MTNEQTIVPKDGIRYYLDAPGFGNFPTEEYSIDRSQYRVTIGTFKTWARLTPSEKNQAFLEVADRHIQEGRDIEAKANSYFEKWNGFAPSEPQLYLSEREVHVSLMAQALIGSNPNPPASPSEMAGLNPSALLQSIKDAQRDLVATYSYALRRYHDVVGCYIAISPESRPFSIREKISEVMHAAERIKNRVPVNIASVCEPYVPAAPTLARWIKSKSEIVLSEMRKAK